jgi:zinc transport system permease protein
LLLTRILPQGNESELFHAAAARPLAETPEQMAVYAAVIGVVAVAVGLFMSLSFDTPGGPSIVLVLAVLFAALIFPSVVRRR